jgi:hypothetical protein
MYFIILTTAATLHAHGMKEIDTAQQAAQAIETTRRQCGILTFCPGTNWYRMIGIPALAGSAAYAVAEAMAWRGSLEDRPRLAKKILRCHGISNDSWPDPQLRWYKRREECCSGRRTEWSF